MPVAPSRRVVRDDAAPATRSADRADRDPRRKYDDLLVTRVDSERPAGELRRLRSDNEAIREGWVAAGIVLDPADRVLVVDLADRGWALPGGTALPGERLARTVEREVREEAGVDAEAVRPHAIHDETIRVAGDGAAADAPAAGDADAADTASADTDDAVPPTPFRVVHFELRAAEATVPDDLAALGDDDETVRAVEWREALPADIYGGDWTERVYERIVE